MTDEQRNFMRALFLSVSDDEYKTKVQEPFLDHDYLVATDGHHLLRIKSSLLPTDAVGMDNYDGPDALSVIPTKLNLSKVITFDELKQLWDKVPMTDTVICEDCGGDGTVRFSYESRDGDTFYTNDTCPVCGGSGEVHLEEKIKDETFPVKIGNVLSPSSQIHWLLRVMDAMQLKEVTLRSLTDPKGGEDRVYFQRDMDIDMLFVGFAPGKTIEFLKKPLVLL